MKKNFITYNSILQEISTLSISEKKLAHYILETGKYMYIDQQFTFNIKNEIENFISLNFKTFRNKNTEKITITEIENGNIILAYFQIKNLLFYKFLSQKELNTLKTNFLFRIPLIKNYTKDLEKFLTEIILERIKEKKFYVCKDNIFINKISEQLRLFLYTHIEEEEIVLALLRIKPKNFGEGNKKGKWFYILTTKEQAILFIDKFHYYHTELYQNPRIDRKIPPVVNIGDKQFNTGYANINLFKELQEIALLPPQEKLTEIARINSLLNKKYSFEYLRFLLQKAKKDINELSILLLQYRKDGEDIKNSYTNEQITKIAQQIIDIENIGEEIQNWFQKWKPSQKEIMFLLFVMNKSIKKEKLCRILPLYKEIEQKFFSDEKKYTFDKNVFEVIFAEFLISCGYKQKAKKLLKASIERLPDINTEDLLPSENYTENYHSLRIKIIELLMQIEDNEKQKTHLIETLAKLQPLNIKNIELLRQSKSLIKFKAENILQILQPGDFIANPAVSTEQYLEFKKQYKELLFKGKESKELLQKIIKWVNDLKQLPIKEIQNFIKPLTREKYPLTYEIISDIAHSLQINNLYAYITEGERSKIFRSYSYNGKNYILIGSEYIQGNSPRYLTALELKFAVAMELTFLKFDFVKITSSDLWRNLIGKGADILDNFFSIVPFVGIGGKILHKILPYKNAGYKLYKISEILRDSENILSAALNSIKYFTTKNKNEQKQELIAISFTMQEIADRNGLIYCGDIVSAIRSLIFTNEYIPTEYVKEISQKGLIETINAHKQEKAFINTAIRINALLRFYLSPEYEKLRRKIIKY